MSAKRFHSRQVAMDSCITPWAIYPSHVYQKYTVINANILSCIIHQLNIKQYHEMTIEYLSFIHFVGRLLLDLSSFMTSSSLIQILIWIRGPSRIQFFIFLITSRIFFESWALDIQFLPSSLLLLWVEFLLV